MKGCLFEDVKNIDYVFECIKKILYFVILLLIF